MTAQTDADAVTDCAALGELVPLRDGGVLIARDKHWIERRAPRDGRGRPVVPQQRDLEILSSLWRGNFLTLGMIAREWWPSARSTRPAQERMRQHAEVSWVTRFRPRNRSGGAGEYVYALAHAGFRLAQHAIGPDGDFFIDPAVHWQEIDVGGYQGVVHDLRAHAWLLAYQRQAGERVAGWLGPREGEFPVPTVLRNGHRQPMTLADVRLPGAQRVDGLASELFGPLVPDGVLELRSPYTGQELDVLIEFDKRGRPSKNVGKLVRADGAICAWWRHVPRWRAIGQPPVVVFVCQTDSHMHALMRYAEEIVRGRIATPGAAPESWPCPGRKRIFFCVESELLAGKSRAFRLGVHSAAYPGELELCSTELPGLGRGERRGGESAQVAF